MLPFKRPLLLRIIALKNSFLSRSCVGWTHGYTDFICPQEAASNCQVGSALSFNRIGFYHFAIYLGLDHLTDQHLVVHLWGGGRNSEHELPEDERLQSASQFATVRIDSLDDVAAGDTIRVYRCDCSDERRSAVITRALAELGSGDYDFALNNCENFVRRVIDDVDISYQTYWTGAAPFVQIPRLLIGAALKGSMFSSLGSAASGLALKNLWSKIHSSCEITDPTGRLLRLVRNRQTQQWQLISC